MLGSLTGISCSVYEIQYFSHGNFAHCQFGHLDLSSLGQQMKDCGLASMIRERWIRHPAP